LYGEAQLPSRDAHNRDACNNRRAVGSDVSVRSVPRICIMRASFYYPRVERESADKSEKLVADAWDSYGNPEEGERPSLEAATKQRNKYCD
jgi:hypothetical protein